MSEEDQHPICAFRSESWNQFVGSVKQMADDTKVIKDQLLGFAVGKDQIPTKTANEIADRVEKSYKVVVKALGISVCILGGVIMFLLTGEHWNFWTLHH